MFPQVRSSVLWSCVFAFRWCGFLFRICLWKWVVCAIFASSTRLRICLCLSVCYCICSHLCLLSMCFLSFHSVADPFLPFYVFLLLWCVCFVCVCVSGRFHLFSRFVCLSSKLSLHVRVFVCVSGSTDTASRWAHSWQTTSTKKTPQYNRTHTHTPKVKTITTNNNNHNNKYKLNPLNNIPKSQTKITYTTIHQLTH